MHKVHLFFSQIQSQLVCVVYMSVHCPCSLWSHRLQNLAGVDWISQWSVSDQHCPVLYHWELLGGVYAVYTIRSMVKLAYTLPGVSEAHQST